MADLQISLYLAGTPVVCAAAHALSYEVPVGHNYELFLRPIAVLLAATANEISLPWPEIDNGVSLPVDSPQNFSVLVGERLFETRPKNVTS